MWRVLSPVLDFLTSHPYLLFVGFLLYVFIFCLSLLLNGKKPGPNPFSRSAVKDPKPVVTDLKARDKVLKQGFGPQKVPENLDAVIIGSGIGGLTTGVMMAKAGKKVLLLEQHDQAGGCCHTFIEKGFEFDVGIHYVGHLQGASMMRCMSDFITDGQLVWDNAGPVYDEVALGDPVKARRYLMYVGKEELYNSLLKRFPKEKVALDKYFKILTACEGSTLMFVLMKTLPKLLATILIKTGLVYLVSSYFKYSSMQLQSTVDSLTDDKDLRAVFMYCFGDFGTVPSKSSISMQAMLVNHYAKGSFYPRGGASEIAYHMIPIIEGSGGRVLVRANVTQILCCEKGQARGVRVSKGGNEYDIYAPQVISAAGLTNTITRLLPKQIAEKSVLSRLLTKLDPGTACMSLFVGLDGSKEDLNLPSYNTWAYTSSDIGGVTEAYQKLTIAEASESEVPLLFIAFPSAKDSTSSERFPGKSTCTVVTFASWSWFQEWEEERVKKRGTDYDALKNGIRRQMWQQVVALFPQLEDKVEYMDIGTPLSNNYYLGSKQGEIYGLDHSMKRFSPEYVVNLRPETDIPGLYLSGQDVFTCGFAGGMFGGLMCAGAALHRNVFRDLLSYRKQVSKDMKNKKDV